MNETEVSYDTYDLYVMWISFVLV